MKSVQATVMQLFVCSTDKGYDTGDVSSQKVSSLELNWDGVKEDRHQGGTLRAGGRQNAYAPQGTELANLRQVSLVSAAELTRIASKLGLPDLTGSDLGANIVLAGIDVLTCFPAGVNGVIQFPSGAILYCMGENEPCDGPGKTIATRYNRPDLANKFPKAAMHCRGIVAMVGHPGIVHTGDTATLFYPAWSEGVLGPGDFVIDYEIDPNTGIRRLVRRLVK